MRTAVSLALVLAACSPSSAPTTSDTAPVPVPDAFRHVHFMHLDGFRPDAFRALLERGQLPHFEFLLQGLDLADPAGGPRRRIGGRISYRASTVDKSETMKAIHSYFSSRRDVRVTAWWQFDRSRMAFRNFWMQPQDVAAYALGTEFPRPPTLFDFLSHKGHLVTAGFSLHRRGVDFEHYSRAYLEGLAAVSTHNYLEQAQATMDGVLASYRQAVAKGGRLPILSTSLLAPADETAHLEGLVGDAEQACIDRDGESSDLYRVVFDAVDAARRGGGGPLVGLIERYFARSSPDRLCFGLPQVEVFVDPSADGRPSRAERRPLHRGYVLAVMFVDMQLGRLIRQLRAIRIRENSAFIEESPPASLAAYRSRGQAEGSLFERTLFVLSGDHGMVQTAGMTGPSPDTRAIRSPLSQDLDWIEYLNRQLGLRSFRPDNRVRTVSDGVEMGIDDVHLPLRLKSPHLAFLADEKSPESNWAKEAVRWAQAYRLEVKEKLKGALYREYWYLLFLRSRFIDPHLEGRMAGFQDKLDQGLAQVYLQGAPEYLEMERRRNRAFYDRHVRLVYGGGARNNAELFLPASEGEGWTWSRRPSSREILSYRGGRLLEALKAHPAVGLIFIRRENDRIAEGRPLPPVLHIDVLDRKGNRGVISVRRAEHQQLVYSYRLAAHSEADPLGYGFGSETPERLGTYDDWNEFSLAERHSLHNVPAGVGSYLYSDNPAIGDLLITHRQGWNFGANAAGHGGLDRGEKLTLMMVSGPGITPGELMSRSRYRWEGGRVAEAEDGRETPPTIVDLAPGILEWLGYPQRDGLGALTRFSRTEAYREQRRRWTARQRRDILSHLDEMASVKRFLEKAGLRHLKLSEFTPELRRLLAFLPDRLDETLFPAEFFEATQEDGNPLILR